MMQSGPEAVTGGSSSAWHTVLKQQVKDKFLQRFGTSRVMPADIEDGISVRRQGVCPLPLRSAFGLGKSTTAK